MNNTIQSGQLIIPVHLYILSSEWVRKDVAFREATEKLISLIEFQLIGVKIGDSGGISKAEMERRKLLFL